jgi:hypothetical protein
MCRTGTTLLTIAQIHLAERGGAIVIGSAARSGKGIGAGDDLPAPTLGGRR